MQAPFIKVEHALRHALHFLSYVALSLHTFVLYNLLFSYSFNYLLGVIMIDFY